MKPWDELTETEQKHWTIRFSLVVGFALGSCVGCQIGWALQQLIGIWRTT